MAAHPFDLGTVNAHGMSIKLVKSEIAGVRMLKFEMEVRSRAHPFFKEREEGGGQEGNRGEGEQEAGSEEESFDQEQEQLMVFDVVMQVVEGAGRAEGVRGGGGGHSGGKAGSSSMGDSWSFVPLSVKLKQGEGLG